MSWLDTNDNKREILSCIQRDGVLTAKSSSVIRSWSRSWVKSACGWSMHEISVFLRWRKYCKSSFVRYSNGSTWLLAPIDSQIYSATLMQNNTIQQLTMLQLCIKYIITKQCLTLLQLNASEMLKPADFCCN